VQQSYDSPEIEDGGEYKVVLHLKATVLDAVGLQAKQMGGFHFADDWNYPMKIPRVALPDHVAQYLDAIAQLLSNEHVKFVPTGQVLEVLPYEAEDYE
jgi:hypothetical protein